MRSSPLPLPLQLSSQIKIKNQGYNGQCQQMPCVPNDRYFRVQTVARKEQPEERSVRSVGQRHLNVKICDLMLNP